MPPDLRCRLPALLCTVLLLLASAFPVLAAASQGLVAVAGASGRTGSLVVRELTAAGYGVRALVRSADDGQDRFADGVEVVVADARAAATLGPALAGATALVIAIGAEPGDRANGPEQVDYLGVSNLAAAAVTSRLQQVVLVSSAGVTREDHPLNRLFDDVLTWKARGEDALRASGVPYTIVRPGGLTAADTGPGAVRLDQGDKGTGFIPRADVARLAVAALGEPAARNRTFEAYAGGNPAPPDWAKLFNALGPDGPAAGKEAANDR
jgi:uncharacterized protein YbjT (DUF2867 family)